MRAPSSGSVRMIDSTIGVRVYPGHTALILMPFPEYESAADFVSPTTACLLAVYAALSRSRVEKEKGTSIDRFRLELPDQWGASRQHIMRVEVVRPHVATERTAWPSLCVGREKGAVPVPGDSLSCGSFFAAKDGVFQTRCYRDPFR
jgi:hypothetical protein